MIDLARVRVVMTAFATQLGQLCTIIESSPTPNEMTPLASTVKVINDDIGTAMTAAINSLPSTVKYLQNPRGMFAS